MPNFIKITVTTEKYLLPAHLATPALIAAVQRINETKNGEEVALSDEEMSAYRAGMGNDDTLRL